MIARVILGFILLFETVALAESQVPLINPSITGTFPHGGQRGQEIEVTLQGRNLQSTQSIHFKSAKLQATVVSSDACTVKARIRVASNAEPGRHDLRLTASHEQRSDHWPNCFSLVMTRAGVPQGQVIGASDATACT